MKAKKLTALISLVSTFTLGSCGFSAYALSSSKQSDDTGYYKTITYSVGTTGAHFIGPTKAKFKPNRPFYTIDRPEAIKPGYTLSCWTTVQDNISTKVSPSANINTDLTLYPYFVDATTLTDVIYTVTSEYTYIWDKTTLCSPDLTTKIKGIRKGATSQTTVEVERSAFNYPLSFGTKINAIPDNFLYGCVGFDSDVSIPAWIGSIGNDFMHGCSLFNKQLIIPSTVTTIGTNFLYNCSAFNKDLVFNSTLTAVGSGFLVGVDAYTSKITVDCPVSVFAGSATESLYSTSSTAAIYTTGYELAGTYAQAFWWKYVDTPSISPTYYRRRQPIRVKTANISVHSQGEGITDVYSLSYYFDDFTSEDSEFYLFLTVSRPTATLTAGSIVVSAYSITDESGQVFSATQAGELGRFNFDAEYVTLKVNLKDNDGNLLTPRGNLSIAVDLSLYTGTHVISGDHNLDVAKATHKFSVPAGNENIIWTISPSDMGSINDMGVLTPSEKARTQGGSATIVARDQSGTWESAPFEVEFGSYDKLSISKVSGQSYSQVKKASDTITGSVVIPTRYWYNADNAFSSVTTLETSAFANASGVTGFVMPYTIHSIAANAFEGCSGITGFDFTYITSIAANAFKSSGLTSIVIPTTLTAIGNNAFDSCSGLASIDLSAWTTAPTWAGTNIFANIAVTGTVNIQAQTDTAVDQWRFNYPFRTLLKNKGITTWSSSAWSFDHEDTAYLVSTVNNIVTGWASGTAGTLTDAEKYNMAMDKYNEPTIVIPSTATAIGDKAFVNASMVSTIPSTLTKLAFESGSAINTIGNNAFYMSTNLKSIDFSNATGLTTIASHSFSGSGITSLTLPASLTSIGEGAFYDTSMTTLVLPVFTNTVTMGLGAFGNNSLLARIDVSAYDTIPTWVCDEYLFEGCANTGYIVVKSAALADTMLAWFKAHSSNIQTGNWTAGI